MGAKNWSIEEVEYLEEKWGMTSIPSIAKHLGRSINSVKNKAYRLGLGRFIHQGEYITLHQLISAIGQKQNYSYLNERLERDGFPIKYKIMINKKIKVIYIKEFWEWTKINQSKIDFSNFEENMLGPEDEWVKVKRKNDKLKKKTFKTTPWTEQEDRRLEQELNKYKYSYKELSEMFNRTEGALQRRICDLGLKARPIKANNHIKWTKEEYNQLGEMIKARYNYERMSEVLGKSAKAIRGRVYDMYITENLDKVVSLIGDGSWGDGRPELNVTHKKLNTAERKLVKTDMSKFLGILNSRMQQLYDENDYWQSKICQNWSKKCLVNIESCDECTNFIRIQPQYCNRCGATVMSREKINICDRCKIARKKSYQKKYMALKSIKSIEV
ncbi:MAG: hypothetical protein E7G24_02550 [Clostridium celatum]|nr:hypothetical protein [Clostridium celatum]